MHIHSLLHTNVSWPKLAVCLSLNLHLLSGYWLQFSLTHFSPNPATDIFYSQYIHFSGCKCESHKEMCPWNKMLGVLVSWIIIYELFLSDGKSKCCWITGVGDRKLDSFCVALIGSILSLSVLISVWVVKSMGYWERFIFRIKISGICTAHFSYLLLAYHSSLSMYQSWYENFIKLFLTRLRRHKYGHSLYGIWERVIQWRSFYIKGLMSLSEMNLTVFYIPVSTAD